MVIEVSEPTCGMSEDVETFYFSIGVDSNYSLNSEPLRYWYLYTVETGL